MDAVLFEVARRLLGRRYGDSKRWGRPGTEAEALLWASAAQFVKARLQTSTAQVANCRDHEKRKADMSPAAGAAMRAVLDEVSRAEVAKWPLANRLNAGLSRQRGWARVLTAMMSACFGMGWFLFPVAWTLGPPGMGIIGIDVQERLYATGDVLAKNCFACLGVLIKFCYLRHLNAPVLDVGLKQAGARRPSAENPAPPPLQTAAMSGNRRSARRASSIMMEEFDPVRKGSHDRGAYGAYDSDYDNGPSKPYDGTPASAAPRSPRSSKQAMHLLNAREGGVKAGELTASEAASMPTGALVRRAAAVLEPLCGRLCVGSDAASTEEIEIEIAAEIARLRQLCVSVLRLTGGAGDASEMQPEMQSEMQMQPEVRGWLTLALTITLTLTSP